MPVILNDLLGREGIKIYQDSDLFHFSLDTILLADFATINLRTKKIIDLCSGNAPIPLYLSLRTKNKIYGVEIQEKVFNLGEMSIRENKKEDQIILINDNLKNISEKIGKSIFDLVTCNPPFFKAGSSVKNPNSEKSIARHEIEASLDDICREASILLNSSGRFAMVHRPDRLFEIYDTMKKYHIEPKRLRFVYPKVGMECNHILIEGIKDGKQGGLRVLPPLYVYERDGVWTEEIRHIYNYD